MKQDEGREPQEKERNIKYQGMCNVSYFAKAKSIKSQWPLQTGMERSDRNVATKRKYLRADGSLANRPKKDKRDA